MATNPNNKNKFYYGWIIVAFSTFALIISNGLAYYGIPAFYKVIREDFVSSGAIPLNQAESFIANGATLNNLFAGIFSLIGGWLTVKYNLRSLMVIGCLIMGAAFLIHAETSLPAVVYLSRILMGISLGFVGVFTNVVLVSNWFRRLRGFALGIVLTGTSIGGFIVPPVATALISIYGWRSSMIILSLAIWILLLPAVIFLVKNRPSDVGLAPDGEPLETYPEKNNDLTLTGENSKPANGVTLKQALLKPLFWIFALCSALVYYPIFVTGQQFILYLQTPKIGLSLQEASLALSLLFAVSVGGKFLFGFLSDRFSSTIVMFSCCTVMFAASLFLLNLTPQTAFFFLIPFGLGYGGTFVLLQRLVADYFGSREYGKILGMITFIDTLGSLIGGKITAYLADAAGGDYTKAFYGVIITTGLALILILIINFMLKTKRPFDSQTVE